MYSVYTMHNAQCEHTCIVYTMHNAQCQKNTQRVMCIQCTMRNVHKQTKKQLHPINTKSKLSKLVLLKFACYTLKPNFLSSSSSSSATSPLPGKTSCFPKDRGLILLLLLLLLLLLSHLLSLRYDLCHEVLLVALCILCITVYYYVLLCVTCSRSCYTSI